MVGSGRALKLGLPIAVLGAALALTAYGCDDDDETGGGGSTAVGGSGGAGGMAGGAGGVGPSYDCAAPTDIPDPWNVTITGGDAQTGLPLAGMLVEILDGSGAVLASGNATGSGPLNLQVPTGGQVIHGTLVASHDGYLTRRVSEQNGLGFAPYHSAWLYDEARAEEFVQQYWSTSWDPTTTILWVGVFECNDIEVDSVKVMGAEVSLATAGLAPVYTELSNGEPQPGLVHTTVTGAVAFANVPAGDNEITVRLPDGSESRYPITLVAGSVETFIAYPRAETPACEPSDVSDFVPEWKPPIGLYQGLCTAQQLSDYYDVCYGPNSDSTCSTWVTENTDCRNCVRGVDSDPVWNGVVEYPHQNLLRIKQSQCVAAFEGDLSADSCGAWMQAKADCAYEACRHNCFLRPDHFGDDIGLLTACESMAKDDDCASYDEVADDCWAALTAPGAAAELCASQSGESFWEWGIRYAGYICGDDPGSGGGGSGGSGGAGGAGGATGGSGGSAGSAGGPSGGAGGVGGAGGSAGSAGGPSGGAGGTGGAGGASGGTGGA